MGNVPLLSVTSRGLYCAAGDFFVDPWQPVDRAVITHAHADHARRGNGRYLTTKAGEHVLRTRMGADATIDTVEYGESVDFKGVRISLHPAGHILGSAQVRLELGGEVWVISGDYKLANDGTCAPFEPIRCHTFITESTFGLPIYRWENQANLFREINHWWKQNQESKRTSVLFAYALGKSQRLLAGVDATLGPIYCHGAVERVNEDYRRTGVPLPTTQVVEPSRRSGDYSNALVIAPPSAMGTPWLRRFGDKATAFVSGWMAVRGARRRRSVDRGFVLSDHADWPGLLEAIHATGAEHVFATHGFSATLVRWLREHAIAGDVLQTEFVGERDDAEIDAPSDQEEGTKP